MAWENFAIGAGIGLASFGWSLIRRPIYGGYPFQGAAAAALIGAVLWGLFISGGRWLLDV